MQQLQEIKARASSATEGPWAVDELGDVETVPEFDLHRFDIMPETIARTELRKEDGAFIAAARTDVPKLVAALEAVAARLDEWGSLKAWPDAEDSQRWYSLGRHHASEDIRAIITKALEAA